jgi:hypothetical protein
MTMQFNLMLDQRLSVSTVTLKRLALLLARLVSTAHKTCLLGRHQLAFLVPAPKDLPRSRRAPLAFAAGAAAWLIPAQLLIAPAKAVNIKTFDLEYSAFSQDVKPIKGTISLDLDDLTNYLWDDHPTGPIPSWVKALSLTVTRSSPKDEEDYLGTFTLADYGIFEWKSPKDGLDFTQELVGQKGWRYTCSYNQDTKVVECSFRLGALATGSSATIKAPNSDYAFQLYSRVFNPSTGFGGVYYGLSSFRPSAVTGAPAPLPLLGAGAALAWSRRLRTRTKAGRRP